jgi:putative SOS response-associated peptidase YedK
MVMCARFTVAGDLSELGKFLDFVCRVAFFAPRYNIAPQPSPGCATLSRSRERGTMPARSAHQKCTPAAWAKRYGGSERLPGAPISSIKRVTN